MPQMEYTYKDLKHKTVAELREIAAGLGDTLKGYTQMNKDHLLEAICKALNIDMHEHHAAKLADKGMIKRKIKLLKRDRDKAIEAKDHVQLKKVRKEIKRLKNELRKALA